jgi:hypothetical protein
LKNLRYLLIIALGFILAACGGNASDAEADNVANGAEEVNYADIYEPELPTEAPETEPAELVTEPTNGDDEAIEEIAEPAAEALTTPPAEELPTEAPTEPATEPVRVAFTLNFRGIEHMMSMADIENMQAVNFSAYPRGVQRNFTGFALVEIFRHFNLDYQSAVLARFASYDGFATAISMADALGHGFIATAEDNQPFAARGDYWANAPFMLVMADDPFPNRWARYITEIEVE